MWDDQLTRKPMQTNGNLILKQSEGKENNEQVPSSVCTLHFRKIYTKDKSSFCTPQLSSFLSFSILCLAWGLCIRQHTKRMLCHNADCGWKIGCIQ